MLEARESEVTRSGGAVALARQGDLAIAMDGRKYGEAMSDCPAEAAILWQTADAAELGLKAALFVQRPRYALAGVTDLYERPVETPAGIHPTAVIDPTASLGEGASIGAFCVIGPRVRIGERARLLPHVVIGEDTVIGSEALLFSGVRVGARVQIGDRFIAQPNAVVGADGFSFVTPEAGHIEEARAEMDISGSRDIYYRRINSLGSVTIGDDVELGANSAIDRGTLSDTTIGNGTKIDNLIQIGHNVKIGENCLLCGQCGVAGSATIGDRVVIGGQAAIGDHSHIGSDSIITGQTGISSNVPSGSVMMGTPAMPMKNAVDSYKALRRLPRLLAKLSGAEKRVSKSEPNR
jgi:UDP-3-O-[3-hydroxymyristoyl] glucosamine N-acyltransferase